MKAAVLKNWLELELTDIPVPTPEKNEALIKVRYGGVCGSDMVVYRHKHMTATIPRVLCHEILGTIETLPEGYEGPFHVGQRVLMNPVVSCGHCSACKRGLGHVCENLELLGIHRDGGFAEYTKVGVDKLVAIPDDFPDEVAILGEPFAVGYHVMVRSQLQKGDTVFISGGAAVGLYIALFAKAYGAGRVIISEINEPRRQFVESMGIETINPAQTDPMDLMREVTGGGGFDMVYDTSGAKSATLQMPDLTRCGGKMMRIHHRQGLLQGDHPDRQPPVHAGGLRGRRPLRRGELAQAAPGPHGHRHPSAARHRQGHQYDDRRHQPLQDHHRLPEDLTQ